MLCVYATAMHLKCITWLLAHKTKSSSSKLWAPLEHAQGKQTALPVTGSLLQKCATLTWTKRQYHQKAVKWVHKTTGHLATANCSRLDNTCYSVLSIFQVCCWGSQSPRNCTAVLEACPRCFAFCTHGLLAGRAVDHVLATRQATIFTLGRLQRATSSGLA